MNIESKLQERIYITGAKIAETSTIDTELANQLVIMEYLQYLGKVITENTNQLEFVVNTVEQINTGQDIELEMLEDLCNCEAIIVEENPDRVSNQN